MAAACVLTDENFETEVLNNEQPVLVDFWGVNCRPCEMLAPTIEQLAAENAGKFRVCKFNVYDSPETAIRFNISAVPTIIIFKNGEAVSRFVGARSKTELQNALNAA